MDFPKVDSVWQSIGTVHYGILSEISEFISTSLGQDAFNSGLNGVVTQFSLDKSLAAIIGTDQSPV